MPGPVADNGTENRHDVDGKLVRYMRESAETSQAFARACFLDGANEIERLRSENSGQRAAVKELSGLLQESWEHNVNLLKILKAARAFRNAYRNAEGVGGGDATADEIHRLWGAVHSTGDALDAALLDAPKERP